MTAVCSLKEPMGFSTVGVDHSYGVLEVFKIANCGKAGMESDIPPNTITRPSKAKKKGKKKFNNNHQITRVFFIKIC